jgi:hypothetical protein
MARLGISILSLAVLAARGASPAAFGRHCIPPGCVVPPSNIPDILGRHALPAGRIAALGATPDLHHGLPATPKWGDVLLAPAAEQAVPFKVGETLTYDVAWSSYLTAGTAVATVTEKKPLPKTTGYSIVIEGRPTPLVSKLYNLYYKIDTLLDASTLLPQRASTYSEEGRRHRLRTTEFDLPENKGRQDPLSAIYVLRAKPLKVGAHVRMAVTNAEKQYTVSFEVGAIEHLRTPIGDVDAWQVKTSIVDTKGETTAKNVALWLTTDARRLPVKVRADLPFGSFTLALRDVR